MSGGFVLAENIPAKAHMSGNVERLLTEEEAIELLFSWYDEFERRWGKESFHNRGHVVSVRDAFLTYIVNSSEENDPLSIRADLQKWNALVGGERHVSINDLVRAAKWLVSHDIGNGLESVELVDGGLKPVYFDEEGKFRFKAKDAEERSADIFETVMTHTDIDGNDKAKLIPLVRHLIDQSRFGFSPGDKQKPFATSMRFIDQIASGLFNNDDVRLLGLAREFMAENPERRHDLDFFYNFPLRRAPELIPDRNVLMQVYDVLGKNPPEEKQTEDKTVHIRELVDMLSSDNNFTP